jgi:hypothetical protein
MPDHVHMMISTPPKYAVSQVVEFIKGKSAIYVPRVYGEHKRSFEGQHFWAEDISSQPLGVTRRRYVSTSAPKKRKRLAWNSLTVAVTCHLQVAPECGGRVSAPD